MSNLGRGLRSSVLVVDCSAGLWIGSLYSGHSSTVRRGGESIGASWSKVYSYGSTQSSVKEGSKEVHPAIQDTTPARSAILQELSTSALH